MLVLVIAPFFTSFLLRTLAWKTILSDNGFVVHTPARPCTCSARDGRLLATPFAVVAGLTYNFLPFMVLPLYASLEKLDPRLLEAASDLYADAVRGVPQGHPAAVACPAWSPGTLLTFIPAAGDYINAELLGTPQPAHDRQRHPSPFLVQRTTRRPRRCSFVLMAVILVMVCVYVRRAGTEEVL